MIIGLDFDGTLTDHEYPDVGEDLGAKKWLQYLADMGCEFILFTMRDGKELSDAARYCTKVLDISLHGVNVNPTQHQWTMSPKAYCHLYIDDNALGVPLKHGASGKKAADLERAGPLALAAARDWYARHGDDYIIARGRYTGEEE